MPGEMTLDQPYQMQGGNFQIKLFQKGINLSARFSWSAFQGRTWVASHYADLSPITGNLTDSDMRNMLSTPSLVTPDFAMADGFYNAGFGVSGLTNQDQAYVYVTESRATWMGDLVPNFFQHIGRWPDLVWRHANQRCGLQL